MKKYQQIILLIGITLLPFLMLEIFLRVSGYQRQFPYRDDADTGYSLQPNYVGPGPELFGIPRDVTLHVNSLGFRGPEIQIHKPPHVRRVLLLGDSCTFGLGIPDHEIYAHLTETLLNDQARADQRYEVINTAVPGYGSFQGLATLRMKGLQLDPDLLVAYFGWNDHWFAEKSIPDEEYFGQMRSYLVERIEKSQRNPLRNLRMYRWLTDRLLRMQDRARNQNLKPNPNSPIYRVPLEAYGKNLRAMAKLAEEGRIPLIFITAPYGFEKGKIPVQYLIENFMKRDDSLIDLHERYVAETRQVARDTHAVLLDMAQFFIDTDRAKLMEMDGIHPNTAGHRIIAHELARTIIRLERQTAAQTSMTRATSSREPSP